MHISINDVRYPLDSGITVEQLLKQHAPEHTGLAVAINNTVLAKRLWPQYQLQPDDAVQLFQIVTGG
ncbi:sulfur carrier protein ThiS [Rheinheimera sp. NSM]|uniref:sulfur carrier protein ThiS n=1 Tax=Rheinheimera sp. NSM TaxID=3457884 RepID=UPI004036709E